MPIVSIIVPIHNSEKYLKECLDSIIKQTVQEIEIILVDDGSTDSSGVICDSYAKLDSRIIVIHKMNGGVSKARNLGIEHAKSKWVMFVDSDDTIDIGMIEQLIKYEEYNSEVIACSVTKKYNDNINNSFKFIELDTTKRKENFFAACILNPKTYRSIFSEDLQCGIQLVYPVAKLYRLSLLKDNNIKFPENISNGEDQIFNLQVIKYCDRISFVDLPLYYYRVNTDSACFNWSGMVNKYLTYLDELHLKINKLDIKKYLDEYLPYRVCDIVKSLLIVSALKAENRKTKKIYINDIKDFMRIEKIKKYIERVEYTEYRSKTDRMIVKMIKNGHIEMCYHIYFFYFKLKNYLINKNGNEN